MIATTVELAGRVLYLGSEEAVRTGNTDPLKLVWAYFIPVSPTTSPPFASLSILAPY